MIHLSYGRTLNREAVRYRNLASCNSFRMSFASNEEVIEEKCLKNKLLLEKAKLIMRKQN